MEEYKYELIVYWSVEDAAFIVDVPELPGCMAHGSTPAAAVGEAQIAIALWIDTAREFGRNVPEPKAAGSCSRSAASRSLTLTSVHPECRNLSSFALWLRMTAPS